MSRIFLDNLRNDINSLFADNNTGQITPALLRGVHLDMVDSLAQDEGVLFSTSPVTVTLTPTYALVPNLLGGEAGGDGLFLILDGLAQSITTNGPAGFTYNMNTQISCDGGNNVVFNLAIFQNGVILRETSFVTGGASRVINISLDRYINASPNGAVYEVRMSSPTSGTLDISQAILSGVIQPTDNP